MAGRRVGQRPCLSSGSLSPRALGTQGIALAPRGQCCGKEGSGQQPQHLPAASWSPGASPEARPRRGSRCKDSLASRPPSPHRRVAAPGTQCPWHGRPPPHYKGPFVPTSLALEPQVTGLCWAQGGSARSQPRPALACFSEGLLAQSKPCRSLHSPGGRDPSPLEGVEHTGLGRRTDAG